MARYVFVLVLGLTVGAVGFAALGEDLDVYFRDFHTHDIVEQYEMSTEVDIGGVPRAPTKVVEERQHYVVPRHYGDLVTLTQSGDKTIFWYQNKDGIFRNVVFDRADSRLLEIEQAPTFKVRTEVAH
ncbi:MAG: hypothetical protein L0Z55_03010 [Planctomycetes bacterium]|nr:hypothetical protein [Planctomycetota bacterium]